MFCKLCGCSTKVQRTSHVERLLACHCTRPQCLRLQPAAHQQQGQRKEGSWKRAWRKEQREVLQAANEASRSQRSSTSCTSMSSMRVNKPYDSAMHPRIQANSKATPTGPNKRQATEGVASNNIFDPESGMVMFEDQSGAQRPDCAMMDPGASSFLMGYGPFCRYLDHLKKLNFPVHEITLKKANRNFHLEVIIKQLALGQCTCPSS